MACDCNRSREFARAAGEDEVTIPCSSEKYSVLYALLPNGDEIKLT